MNRPVKKRKTVRTTDQAAPLKQVQRWRQWMPVALILLAAIVFRVVYLLQYRAHIPYYSVPIVDSSMYDMWAQKVAAGEGYGARPFYTAPLYPYLLALLYKFAGHKLVLVYIIQAALGVMNLLLVYMIGRRVFSHRAGLVAMCLLALYAPLAFLESKLLTEPLSVTLGLVSTLLLMRTVAMPTLARFVAAGIVLGVAVVCRANALITVVLIVAWLLFRARGRAQLGRSLALQVVPLLLGIMLAILPVTVRNYTAGRDFALLTTNGGIVFSQANNEQANGISLPLPGFTGTLKSQQDEEMRIASKELGRSVTPSESSSYWFRRGLRYIREHPGGFAWLTVRKVLWSLHNGESPCIYSVYLEKELVPALRLLFLPVSVLIAFGFYGMARSTWRRDKADAKLLALTVLSVFLSLWVFSVSSRYRAPAAPFLAVFAGFGVWRLIDLITERDLRGLGIAVGCIAPLLLVSLVPYPRPYITSEAPANLGMAYLVLGRDAEAEAQLEKAVEMRPGFAYARVFLGRALARQERYEEAIVQYEKALDQQPENAEAHYLLGYALASIGRFEEAIRQYEECLRLKPDYSIARPNLGIAHNSLAIDLYDAGRYQEAWAHLRQARKYGVEPNPEFLKALSEKKPVNSKQ